MGLSVAQSLAQTPDPRVEAAIGPEAEPNLFKPPVWEPTIAAGATRIIAAYNVGARVDSVLGRTQIGYAMAVLDQYETWTWTHEGVLPPPDPNDPNFRAIDPSIAYNSITGDFVLIGIAHGFSPVGVAHALPLVSGTNAPFADGWEELDTESELPGGDKPWIVAGEMNEQLQEFYLSYNADAGGANFINLHYARSTDGGYTWVGGPIEVNSTQVEGLIGSYMAVRDGGPLYVLNVVDDSPGATLRVLKGEDQLNGTVAFAYLPAAPFLQIPYLEIPVDQYSIQDYVPRPSAAPWSDITAAPRIAADPTDPNALHIVYADLVDDSDPDDGDVDVFYVKATRHYWFGSPYWTASNPLRVNDDNPLQNISDQYLPDIAVDSEGVIHVIFYDDRDFTQDDDETDVKFHVYYAYSDDSGANFSTNVRFHLEDPEDPPSTDPCVDEEAHATTVYYEFGEYIGLAIREIGDGLREVWTSYSGTSAIVEDEDEQSVIWSTRIPWLDE